MKDYSLNGLSGRSGFLIRVFGTLLAFALLAYLLKQQGWREIGGAIQQIPLWRFGLALGLIIVSRFAVSGRWHVLLISSGVGINFWQTVRLTFAGLFASNFLPTTIGGDVVRLAGALQLNFDAVICAASLIVDRLVGMAGMAMAVPFGLPRFLQSRQIPNAYFQDSNLLFASTLFPLGRWWKSGWERGLRISKRLIKALSIWMSRPRALIVALGISWIHMLCLFSIIWVFFGGMGQDISFWLVSGLYSIVYFITLLPFSINGYGIQEISMTFIFSTVGGVSVQSGLTNAILFRTLMMLASLPGVIFVPGLMPGAKKQAEAGMHSQSGE
jgi:uncharacterized membrane protein YbhN (UPF0104 family)